MRLTISSCLLALLIAVAGCSSSKSGAPEKAKPASKPAAEAKPIIRASDVVAGKVVTFNAVGRFAVLNFPVNKMPAIDQKVFVYRDGLKVGEMKITGPQKDDNIVGDLIDGDAKPGDELRDR